MSKKVESFHWFLEQQIHQKITETVILVVSKIVPAPEFIYRVEYIIGTWLFSFLLFYYVPSRWQLRAESWNELSQHQSWRNDSTPVSLAASVETCNLQYHPNYNNYNYFYTTINSGTPHHICNVSPFLFFLPPQIIYWFSIQSLSLTFLSGQHFDFQKQPWLSESTCAPLF